ncbi:unnamed protein product [Schistosoma margrebowiei]|uniref:Uncharacterized protein n=1 Tax=Schistosoma margrebowiei TaxID=48269 RepID=A0A183LMT0_9TREM|nr:unnamed protein product [Schistosoma margrebowiei]
MILKSNNTTNILLVQLCLWHRKNKVQRKDVPVPTSCFHHLIYFQILWVRDLLVAFLQWECNNERCFPVLLLVDGISQPPK